MKSGARGKPIRRWGGAWVQGKEEEGVRVKWLVRGEPRERVRTGGQHESKGT